MGLLDATASRGVSQGVHKADVSDMVRRLTRKTHRFRNVVPIPPAMHCRQWRQTSTRRSQATCLCFLSIVLAIYRGRAGVSGPVLPLDDDNLLYRISRVHTNAVEALPPLSSRLATMGPVPQIVQKRAMMKNRSV